MPGLGKQSVFAHATGCHSTSWTSSAQPVGLARTTVAAGLAQSLKPPERPGDFKMLCAARFADHHRHQPLPADDPGVGDLERSCSSPFPDNHMSCCKRLAMPIAVSGCKVTSCLGNDWPAFRFSYKRLQAWCLAARLRVIPRIASCEINICMHSGLQKNSCHC